MADADNTETWLPVAGWEGLYEVSDLGRVRSIDRETTFKDGRVRKFYGTVLSGAADRDGYIQVMLKHRDRRQTKKVHRLVLEAFVGECPDGMESLHRNHRPSDNRIKNLTWGSHRQNMSDKSIAGRHYLQKRTHCPRGHLLEEPNLVPSALKIGKRTCRACGRASTWTRNHNQTHRLQEVSDKHYEQITSS